MRLGSLLGTPIVISNLLKGEEWRLVPLSELYEVFKGANLRKAIRLNPKLIRRIR